MNNPNFHVNSYSTYNTGECINRIRLTGRGIKANFEIPCSTANTKVINTGDSFIVGDPNRDEFVLFSDQPSTLYVINNDRCYETKYYPRNGSLASSSRWLNYAEFNTIKTKIADTQQRVRVLNQRMSSFNRNQQNYVQEMNRRMAQEVEEQRRQMEQQFKHWNVNPPGYYAAASYPNIGYNTTPNAQQYNPWNVHPQVYYAESNHPNTGFNTALNRQQYNPWNVNPQGYYAGANYPNTGYNTTLNRQHYNPWNV